MITFSVLSDSAVKLTFDGNSHYLQDGEITVPKNSLALVKDESELITFIKAATGDAYLSFHIEDTNFANYTELENWYKTNMVSAYGGGGGGGGVTSGEVQTMIDNSISGKANTSAVTSAVTELNAALSGKANTSAVTSAVTEITAALSGKADESYVETALADKVDVSELEEVELAVAQSINVLAQSVSGKQDTLVYYSEDTETNEGKIGTSFENGGVTRSSEVRVTSNDEESAVVSMSASEHSDDYEKSAAFYGTQDGIEIDYDSADNVEGTSINHMIYVNADGIRIETNNDDGESTNTTDFSVTPDGVTINGDEIVTESDLTASLSGKQDTLVAGSGITISGNVISADGGGGGATYSAGTNISIDTANTISCTLNLRNGTRRGSIVGINNETANGEFNISIGDGFTTAGTVSSDNYSIALGGACKARKSRSFAFGSNVDVKEIDSAAFGQNLKLNLPRSFAAGYGNTTNNWCNTALGEGLRTNNRGEFATGLYNNSVTGSTAADNTVFSVGNGSDDNSRHNTFEIRQNGDIYITSGGTDVKLQDHFGGSSITVDPTLDSGSTNPVANSAITAALSGKADFSSALTDIKTYGINKRLDFVRNSLNQVIGFFGKINDRFIYDKNSNQLFYLVETSAITTSMTSGSTDSQVPSAKAVYDALGGFKIVGISQADYDLLPVKDPNTLYIITNVVNNS